MFSPRQASRWTALAIALAAASSQVSCQMANYQLNRLMQIPASILQPAASVLRVDAGDTASEPAQQPDPAKLPTPAAVPAA
ncbi:MAG: hypothetical protein JNK37_15065 [Verrucomicrobiales bacterium]|nr:hypothetical protein [Verrucomicrobiales bacterium]